MDALFAVAHRNCGRLNAAFEQINYLALRLSVSKHDIEGSSRPRGMRDKEFLGITPAASQREEIRPPPALGSRASWRYSVSLSQALLGEQNGDGSSQGSPGGGVSASGFIHTGGLMQAGACFRSCHFSLRQWFGSSLRWVSSHHPVPVPFL